MTHAVPILARDYLPSDLSGASESRCRANSSCPSAQTADETDFLLKLAEETDFVSGVIGWFDPEDENFPLVYEL
jgi:L-fuconolactonase